MSLQVQEVWDSVASAWEHEAGAIEQQSEAFTGLLVDRLDVRRGDRLLELAAGPGSLGKTWSSLVGPKGSVVLTDVSPAMVSVAARRNSEFPNVRAEVLDAGAIETPEESFDAVVCRMGLMFVPEPAEAFDRIRRTLVSGGRFATATWAGPQHNAWITALGLPIVDGPGLFSLADPEQLSSMLGQAGFSDVSVDEVDFLFHAGSIEDHVRQISSLAPLPPGVVIEPGGLAPFATGDGVDLPARALVVAGRRG